jgi:acetyl-CoA synthetase
MQPVPWKPTSDIIMSANITHFMAELGIHEVRDFHKWTILHYQKFWLKMLDHLGIIFKSKPHEICDLTSGLESPNWLPGSKMNIADSCFRASSSLIAILYEDDKKQIQKMTYAELEQLSNRVANSLVARGLGIGDPIAIIMPMTWQAIAIYLGIIKMGGIVVSIADSFSSKEIASRLTIAKTKVVVTQDTILWMGKCIPLYEKICEASAPLTIILPSHQANKISHRSGDSTWDDFILENPEFISVACDPMTSCNILFSSGTTAEPKAIPWNHTTPIKVASDAYFHQNIQSGDILAWPTNLGWMMGPWLLFAALINQATIAVYPNSPKEQAFGEFIQNTGVTMLGVVPTLVANWKQSKCMEKLDWSAIKVFSSTGECSNAEDMQYLMSLANNKPVIEYCGGTEIGGAYLSSTVIQNNFPAQFSTPAMGANFVIIDETGNLANTGEVAIIPPALGLSNTVLNANHHEIYFANMPKEKGKILRRHGDQITHLANGYYCILGRADDSMNLGGIKVSAAEIERALVGIAGILEVAAIAYTLHGGPNQLIIYAVPTKSLDKIHLLQQMQHQINHSLNPLFKIHDVILIDELPKTASNKIMRRMLRQQYSSKGMN